MYYFIKGKYVTRGDNFAVIENGGIGYKIFTSAYAIEALTKAVGEVTVFTHLYVREDMLDLYGFPTNEELKMFLNLLTVSGVGPKAALAIMSVASPERFALAVITNDVKTITKATGVGPKLAQRVILELKDKVKTTEAISAEEIPDEVFGDAHAEAVSALVVLGYSPQEAKKAVTPLKAESVEELVKEGLKRLMK